MTPLVSVVIPTRNRREALAGALSSVAGQSFRDYEVVVVDDGSSDGTAAWLRAESTEARLVELERPLGAAAARNRGIEQARGELVAFLDDDDRWREGYLAAQVERLEADRAAVLSFTGHVEIDALGRVSSPDLRPVWSGADPLVRLFSESFIHTLSVVVCRRATFDRFGRFDESLSIVHDLDWYGRVLAGGGGITHVPRALVERGVPGGLVSEHREWRREERSVFARHRERSPQLRRHGRSVGASRALLFARIGFAKRDLAFGLARLAEALLLSPLGAPRVAAVRLARRAARGRRAAAEAWDAGAAR